MDKKTAEAIRLLTDSIVSATCAIDALTQDQPKMAEHYIKSSYYGLDNALTIARRQMAGQKPGANAGSDDRQARIVPFTPTLTHRDI